MKRILPFVFLFSISPVLAQTVLENNPSGLRWFQVNTTNFRVLFPKGFESQAQRMANTLEHIRDVEARSLGTRPKKISVILQNQSATSNGFVSMLPRRSEFYTMAPQDYNFLGTNDWLNLLAAHEYRHVVQYQHATRGFTKFFYYAFGYTGLAGVAQLSAPSWFWEGDAVATETAFTHSGRGRIPNFDLVFKTNLMEGRTFDYHKQYLRSYKHNIPDHYVLGYHMVSYLRRKTNNPLVWGNISARTWSEPFIPFAFSRSIRKETGMSVSELYEDMATNLKKEWKEEIDQLHLTAFENVNPRTTKAYTDYLYPQPMADGSVVALKQGIGDIQKFVLLKDGQEQRIFTPGYMNDSGMLSAGYTAVLWNEYGYDPRWGVRNYSLIKMYDYKTKQKRVIGGKHNRYGSAALSPTGDKIVTVRSGNDYQNTVVVLEIFSGKVILEFPNTENHFYAMPRWSDDGKNIVVLKTTSQGKTISILDVETKASMDLLPPSQENVGYPVGVGRYIFFNSPVTGIDNIYALDTQTSTRYQVTSSKYGAYNPGISADRKWIYYNEQAKDGMDVVKIAFDTTTWKVFEGKKEHHNFYQHLVEQEGRPNLFDSIPRQQLAVTKYSKLKGIINPYSWGILANSDNLMRANIGITSRDILSTTNITAGYTYDLNENTGFWRAGLSFQGWYPIIDLDFTQGNRTVNEGAYQFYDTLTNPVSVVTKDVVFKWTEKNLEAGLRIPLNTTHSKYGSGLTLGNAVGFTEVSEFRNSIDGGGRIVPVTDSSGYFFREYVDNGTLLYNHLSLTGYRLLKQSRRDINSKWGQMFYLDLYNTPYGGDFSGLNFSFYGIGYFPGFVKHHSIWGYWAYQNTKIDRQDPTNYTFRSQIPMPRGQNPSRFQDFYSMSGNYTLPLWYPDFTVGPWLNVQRIRANVFFDYGFGSSAFPEGPVSRTYTSTGVEVKFDINIMRFLPQFDIGVRYSYGISPATTQFEVLIGTFTY